MKHKGVVCGSELVCKLVKAKALKVMKRKGRVRPTLFVLYEGCCLLRMHDAVWSPRSLTRQVLMSSTSLQMEKLRLGASNHSSDTPGKTVQLPFILSERRSRVLTCTNCIRVPSMLTYLLERLSCPATYRDVPVHPRSPRVCLAGVTAQNYITRPFADCRSVLLEGKLCESKDRCTQSLAHSRYEINICLSRGGLGVLPSVFPPPR